MVRLTLIARVRDGLPLAEGLDGEKDRDLDSYKHQAKAWAPLFAATHTDLLLGSIHTHLYCLKAFLQKPLLPA